MDIFVTKEKLPVAGNQTYDLRFSYQNLLLRFACICVCVCVCEWITKAEKKMEELQQINTMLCVQCFTSLLNNYTTDYTYQERIRTGDQSKSM